MKKIICLGIFISISILAKTQVLTAEDSLSSGLIAAKSSTIISGYGEASVSYLINEKQGEARLNRVVLFVGHKFNSKISLFTELEVEDAKVEGGEAGGEVAMEQAFLKFDLNPSNYIVAGLFIPRIGIINENHLPTTFNGTERPLVERLVIPSTWRELGIGYYGNSQQIRGLNYNLTLTNGLNAAGFQSGNGIRGGRWEGATGKGVGMAVSGALLYYYKKYRVQLSSYLGGTSSNNQVFSDSNGLHKGAFANAVLLNEMNVQFKQKRIEVKLLGTMIHIPNAYNINKSFQQNTARGILGAYAELGYQLLNSTISNQTKSLLCFGRIEYIDLNWKVASNGIKEEANKTIVGLVGLTYKPIRNVAIKFDYTHQFTGARHLTDYSFYYKNSRILNVGLAYNF